MIDRLDIVSVPISDYRRSLDFYVRRLRLRVVRDEAMGEGQRWMQLAPQEPNSATLTLVTWFADAPPGSCQGLVLSTSDVDGAVRDLRAAGVECADVTDAPWGRFTTLKDPDGNGLVISEAASAR